MTPRSSASSTADRPRTAAETIGPDDPRYADLVRRGFNKRFTSTPDVFRLVQSTDQIIDALQAAVRDGKHVVVRSGGHCLENFVANPDVRVIIDMSLMTGVSYDAEMNAFVVESGTLLGEVYRRLYLGWGVLLPAGVSPDVGAGGHILGGAFGFLCREHGLAVDYLYAVEVVVVDDAGQVTRVIATRDASDPNRDLWWAHTGGGGGNFGIVTRYWLRSPDATGTDPRTLLPAAPKAVATLRASWKWGELSEPAFARMLRNFGDWCERHAAADSPYANLYVMFSPKRHEIGTVDLIAISTAGGDAAERQFDDVLTALNAGAGVAHTRKVEHSSWLAFATNPFPELFRVGIDNARCKMGDAYLRKGFSDRQIGVVYDYMTRTDHHVLGGSLGMVTYGGRVNTVPSDATAKAQRGAVITMACAVGWGDPKDEAASTAWVRAFYRDLFAETGGVPVPNDASDGAMINHPDIDLANPAWNTSGVPWHTLYYKDNYPRLQRVKARWDPRNIFHHALSIRA